MLDLVQFVALSRAVGVDPYASCLRDAERACFGSDADR